MDETTSKNAKRQETLDAFLKRLHDWRETVDWLTKGTEPSNPDHGIEYDQRWIRMDGERFTEDDKVWVTHSGTRWSVNGIESRTAWRKWPEACDRPEGPQPHQRMDELRIELGVGKDRGYYHLYCTLASDGPVRPIGACELRTFADDQDPTPPEDPHMTLSITSQEQDDLFWLALVTIEEHLPGV